MSTVANKVDFQDWLLNWVERKEWTQSDLASKAGVDRQIVHGWLKLGKKPNEENLQRIAKALELPYETVYKAAGMKLSPTSVPEDIQQVTHELEDLNSQDRAEVIAYIKMLKNLRKKNEQ